MMPGPVSTQSQPRQITSAPCDRDLAFAISGAASHRCVDDQTDETCWSWILSATAFPQQIVNGYPVGVSQSGHQIGCFCDHPFRSISFASNGRAFEQAAQAPYHLAGAGRPRYRTGFPSARSIQAKQIQHQRGGVGVDKDGAQRLVELGAIEVVNSPASVAVDVASSAMRWRVSELGPAGAAPCNRPAISMACKLGLSADLQPGISGR
jgi:hypothetical protein